MKLSIFSLILVCIFVAALAGITASIYTNQALDRYLSAVADEQSLRIEEVERSVTSASEEEAILRLLNASDSIFAYLVSEGDAGFVQLSNVTAVAIPVSADGWFILPERTLEPTQLYFGGVRHQVTEYLSSPYSAYALVKIDANPTPINIGRGELFPGKRVIAVTPQKELISTHISVLSEPEVAPDAFDYRRGLLATEVGNAALFGANGDFLGFNSNGLIHASTLQNELRSVLRSGAFEPAGMGIYTLHVVDALNLSSSEYAKRGALVSAPRSGLAVLSNGPATDILQAGDMILAINGEELTADKHIGDILSGYSAGDEVFVAYLRDGTEMSERIELRLAEDLLY
jgi:hypothetical protein